MRVCELSQAGQADKPIPPTDHGECQGELRRYRGNTQPFIDADMRQGKRDYISPFAWLSGIRCERHMATLGLGSLTTSGLDEI